MRDLIDALSDWPCDDFGTQPGGRHYQVDYTVARARKGQRALNAAVTTFPTLFATNVVAHVKENE